MTTGKELGTPSHPHSRSQTASFPLSAHHSVNEPWGFTQKREILSHPSLLCFLFFYPFFPWTQRTSGDFEDKAQGLCGSWDQCGTTGTDGRWGEGLHLGLWLWAGSQSQNGLQGLDVPPLYPDHSAVGAGTCLWAKVRGPMVRMLSVWPLFIISLCIVISLKKNWYILSLSDSTAGKEFILHMTDLSSIPGILQGLFWFLLLLAYF